MNVFKLKMQAQIDKMSNKVGFAWDCLVTLMMLRLHGPPGTQETEKLANDPLMKGCLTAGDMGEGTRDKPGSCIPISEQQHSCLTWSREGKWVKDLWKV